MLPDTPFQIILLGTAFLVLGMGFGLLVRIDPSSRKYNVYTQYSLILIMLFPVLLLASFFPSISEASAQVSTPNASLAATGAVAVYVFLVIYGSRKMKEAVELDKLYAEKEKLENEIRSLTSLKKTGGKGDDPLLPPGRKYGYELKNFKGKRIIIVTGSLAFVHGVDVWVNSENTHMQMASHYDRSVSGLIRYLGARKDSAGNVVVDHVYKELRDLMSHQNSFSVAPARVLATWPYQLGRTHGVKRIFHVATVQGECGEGFKPVGNLTACVYNALAEADHPKYAREGLHSIVLPIFGTGQARGIPLDIVRSLINAVFIYFERYPESNVNDVYFVALFEKHLEACRHVLCRPDVVPPLDQLELQF